MGLDQTDWEKLSRRPGIEESIGDFRENLGGEPDFLRFVWNKWVEGRLRAGVISLAAGSSAEGRAPGRRGRSKKFKATRKLWEEVANAVVIARFLLLDVENKDKPADWGISKAECGEMGQSLEDISGVLFVALGRKMPRGAPADWTRHFWCAALLPYVYLRNGKADGWWDWFARWLCQLGEDVPDGGGAALSAWWKKSKRTQARLSKTKSYAWRDARLDALPPFNASNLYSEWKGFKPGSSAKRKYDALVLALIPFLMDLRSR